tara:strand:+ start:3397 stop:3702 length:306 start_codon:yes stop_codon:yes gene_type:complete
MKNLINKLKNYLTEVLKSDDMMLVSKSEFGDDIQNIKDFIEEVKNRANNNLYVSDDAIRDAVHDAIYNMHIADDLIEGIDDVESECQNAINEVDNLMKKYI